MPRRIEDPECATFVGHEDPSVSVNGRPHRTHQPARNLRGGLAVGADPPDHAGRTIGYDDVAVRQLRTDAVDALLPGPIRQRTPDAGGMRLRTDGHHPVATLLRHQDAATAARAA